MLPTVSIPAHEPPQQRPRQALLRGGEGTLPLPGVRPQRQVARLLGPVAADVVPDPQGFARGGGVRHEVLVAQAHRPPGAQPGAHPLRRQVQDRPTHGCLPHGASFVVPHNAGLDVFLEGLSKRRYYSSAVAHQVDRVQVYAGHHREGERAHRRFGGVHDHGLAARRAYGLVERARQPGVRAEPGGGPAPLVQQARQRVQPVTAPSSLELEVVLELRVALYVVPGVYTLHPLASHPGPERAGLLRSVPVEDVQPFAAGAERNAEAFSGIPRSDLWLIQPLRIRFPTSPTLSILGWLPSTTSSMVDPLRPRPVIFRTCTGASGCAMPPTSPSYRRTRSLG